MMSDLAQNLPTSSCHLVRNGQFKEGFRSKTFQAPEALASRGLPLSLPRNLMPGDGECYVSKRQLRGRS